MGKQGYKNTTFDHLVFVRKFSNDDFIILLLYVNDMLIVGNNASRIDKLKKKLSQSFAIKDLSPAKQSLGIRINHEMNLNKLYLSKEKYIEKVLQRFHMDKAKMVSSLLATHFKLSIERCPFTNAKKNHMERVSYTSKVGSLIYVMVCTRLDIAHVVNVAWRFMSNPEREHWNAIKWIMRNLRGTSSLRLSFVNGKPFLVGYTNVDMVRDVDTRKSISGYSITFEDRAIA